MANTGQVIMATLLLLVIIVLTVVDIFANVATLLPFVGTIAETTSETMLEVIGLLATAVLYIIGVGE